MKPLGSFIFIGLQTTYAWLNLVSAGIEINDKLYATQFKGPQL